MKLKKIFSLAFAGILMTSLFVGCGDSKDKPTINIFNAGDYIDPTLLKDFERETGVKVNYETFETNEIMYQKLKTDTSSYDLVIPSDYMVEKMIKEDMLEKIDFKNIPNYCNIDDKFKNLAFDPTNEYSVPYMWGTIGILYNKKMVKGPIDSWDVLWDPKYKGQVFMLDAMRDSLGITLKKLGCSLNSTDSKEINEAKDELIKQKPNVLAYVGDEVKDRMVADEAALAVIYSGDAPVLKERNPDLEYVIPKEGTNLWFDSMVIPKGAKHKEYAEKFINFMLDPEIAKQNVEYIGYSTPNKAALELLNDDIKNDKNAYPDEGVLKKCEVFKDLGDNIKKYDEAWMEVKSN
ncbi:ABC transporter substrate-binding protein [Clostridium fallax]|uniref:ABC transporter substrate-binding protein n=1 Tax=Clostridium fallax TaxID=1533 RepID=UPI003BFA766D